MSNSSKICVMTGTRAEYGLFYWLLRDLAEAPDLELQLVVSGTHLADEFGHTIDFIRDDGFRIDAEVPYILPGDDNAAMGRSMGQAVLGFVDAFDKLVPDILVLLGDRFEVLSAAAAATALRIPIAHIHGGEITEGAIDDAFRHAVTKMSHLHFVAAPEYATRVIQLGEAPERVYTVGSLGIDNLSRLKLPELTNIEQFNGLDLSRGYFLVTYHPATLEDSDPVLGLEELFAALEHFSDYKLIVSMGNADPGARAINTRLKQFAASAPERIRLCDSLGQASYLATLKEAAAVLGNSSSGIIEAPSVGVPTVNIGTRQAGRLRASSIIDCAPDRIVIAEAIEKAISPGFRGKFLNKPLPYSVTGGGAAAQIVAVLREIDLDLVLFKKFQDLEYTLPS